jgi:hypothetical protein
LSPTRRGQRSQDPINRSCAFCPVVVVLSCPVVVVLSYPAVVILSCSVVVVLSCPVLIVPPVQLVTALTVSSLSIAKGEYVWISCSRIRARNPNEVCFPAGALSGYRRALDLCAVQSLNSHFLLKTSVWTKPLLRLSSVAVFLFGRGHQRISRCHSVASVPHVIVDRLIYDVIAGSSHRRASRLHVSYPAPHG